ncbi:ribosome recycling factor [Candidatus Woesebacteria bacterium RBG_16_34_12]|uniref:Ribosome recycling factor n=1 Tax=Candidatus Woesebacteria bacterium RBG_16_34_12 TaxID=1802480 RepID=A0A1F7X7H7_9BACT|nr:MAG: ribosome recycling factor [Candidatus Woesebacteria bacterium RBG_16_34_12]
MNEDSIRLKMQEVLDLVTSDIASVRSNRASGALVEDLQVSVYGGQQRLKINELATITTSDPQTIIIDPWDKSIIGEIKKGIEAANIGLTPSISGEIIRISIPPMTSEDRQKYIKLLSTKIENGKVMIRQIRGDVMRDIKKMFEEKSLSEDEKFNQEKRLQEITDDFIEKTSEIGKKKEEELLQI